MDREDTQGIALHGYRRQPFARYHLLTFGAGDARRLLTRLVGDVSGADEARRTARHHVAFSASGLAGLGLGEPEMAQFSREFRQGMAHPERAAALGDTALSAAQHWDFGGPRSPLDALWMTFANSEAELSELAQRREALFERFGISWQAHDAQGALAPAAAALRKPKRSERVPAGEFLLGERNVLGERQRGPFVPVKFSARPMPDWSRARRAFDFGLNGSYLVLRKLEQVADGGAQALSDGALHARAHRLLLRSRSYDQGVWFMALNADLRQQFEYLQEAHWRGQLDPTRPTLADSSSGRPADETRHLFRVRGGAYLFLPGIRALNYLAEARG